MPLRKTPRGAAKKTRAKIRSSNIKEFLATNPHGKAKKPMSRKKAVKQAVAISFAEEKKPKERKPKAVAHVKTRAVRKHKASMKKPSLAKAEKAMNKAAHRRVRNIGRS